MSINMRPSSHTNSIYRMGIKGKLYIAIGLIVSLTVAMGGISWHLFQTSSQMIGSITQKTVPAMLAAAKISTTTAQLNEEIPNIASVETVEELSDTYQALKAYLKKQEALILEIQVIDHDKTLSELVQNKSHEIGVALEAIHQSVKNVLLNTQLLRNRVNTLVQALSAFEHEITVLVDDAFYTLIIEMEPDLKFMREGNQANSLQTNAEQLTALLEVKADGNLVAGLLGIASQHNEIERLTPLKERFLAAIGRLKRQLDELKLINPNRYQKLHGLVLEMIRLGEDHLDIFDIRTAILMEQRQFDTTYAHIKEIARAIDRAEETLVNDILARVEQSTQKANNQLATGRLVMIFGAIASVVFSFLIGWLYIGQNIIRRMTQLGQSMLHIAKGEFSQPIPSEGNDEITEMADAVKIFKKNMMENQQLTKELQVAIEKAESAKEQISIMNVELEQRVLDRTQELQEANQHLQTTLEDLQLIQTELVEAEKMASLGRLVAGISHEINTPVGNAVTAASSLRERMQFLQSQHQGGDLSKRKFEDFIHSGQRISELILDNLKRAANLVSTFKQISVDDQTLEAQKPLNMHDCLMQLKTEIMNHFKANYELDINIQCPSDLIVISQPKCIFDVLQSLMSDSVIHGFKERMTGRIEIEARLEAKQLMIDYRDDGCGMDQETLAKIFDPFYTTSRDHGGSGLGMHIVYITVVQKLKGKIKCQSQLGQGVYFSLQIPVEKN